VNAVFPQVFPPLPNAERGHVTYAEAMATRDDNGGGVQVHPLLLPRDKDRDKSKSKGDGSANPDDADAVANRLEAEAILALIDATWQARPQADIAVLVRAKDHLAPLTDSLRRLRPDWPYEAVDIDRLNERQPVQDLLALTRALCHRADRVNWLAILRAPWCGLTLADLHQLAAQKRTEEKVDSGETVSAGFATHRDTSRTTIWSLMNDPARRAALSDDGRQRLDHVLVALTPLLMAPGRLNLRRSVETAWRRLNGPACLADETATADVAAYFNLLDMLASTGRFDLDRLENDVASLFAVASSDPQAARLRFMTIHKSKGLEFDTVILPGLHRRTGRHETRLLTWDSAPDEHGQQRLVVAPIRSQSVDEDDARAEDDSDVNADTDTDSDSLRRYIAALENERADQEARRLLYVAATRAKRELHLLAVARPKRDEKTGTWALDAPKSSRGTPFNILWPALADVFLAALPAFAAVTAGDAPALLPQARLADFVPQLQRLSIDDLAVPTTVAAEAAEAAEGDMSAAVEMAEATATATATATTGVLFTASPLAPDVGTLAHCYLELIAAEGVSHWSTARLATCRPACERWLRQQGHAADASRGGAERVIALLTRTLASERGQWLLRRREAGDACEWRLTQPDGSGLRQHIIDRSFIEAGVRWVIDYKTGGHEGGDTDAFIAAKRAEYAPQLERYAALLVHAGLPVRRALYFLDLDRFEELT
jgi:ATP-dependent exoDNAse (exonuclease V) beta subunit